MNALALHLSVLDDLLERRLPASAREVLDDTRMALALLPGDASGWLRIFRDAHVRVGGGRAVLTDREREVAVAAGCQLLAVMTLPELVRGVLLVGAAQRLGPRELAWRITDRWENGSEAERCAIMRWLSHLPEPERWSFLARDCIQCAGRREFETLVCENPYPLEHLSREELHAIVARARSEGLSLQRIEGLESHPVHDVGEDAETPLEPA